MKNKSIVSIVVTSKNEHEVIYHLFKSVEKQTYRSIECILVDNNSQDDTAVIARKFKRVKIYQYGPERSAQRNFGAEKSNGTYLFFLDADMRLTPRVVSKCVQAMQADREIGCVVIPEKSIAYSFWEKVKAFERSFYNEKGDAVTDAARFFSKEVFNMAGGYDTSITGPEDWDLHETIKEMGYKSTRINEKIYHKERITSVFNLALKKYYYGLKAYRYLGKHNISPLSAKTIFFFRPIFYKNWRKIISHPILFLSMHFMFSIELIAGAIGYLVGRLNAR